MTKNDLQTGMVLEFENGGRAMVIRSIYGDGIYYADDGCNEQDDLRILSDDLLHTSCYAPNYGKVMRVLKTQFALAEMCPKRIVETCKYASIVLWERTVYPKWFQAKNGTIVKFIDLQEGTVVVQGNGTDCVGFHFKNWVPHTVTNIWTEVTEPVPEFTMAELEEMLGFRVKIVK